MKTKQTAIKALTLAGILASLTIGTALTAQETEAQPSENNSSKADYVSVPMPMFKMLTSADKNAEKPKPPEFFIYGSDGQLTPASTDLSEVMKNKFMACGQNADSENNCTAKPQNPPGKWANEDSASEGKMVQNKRFSRPMEFVLMTPDDFNSLVQKKSDSMSSKAAERRSKMMEKVNDSNNAVEAKVDGKDVKVIFLPMPKMQPPKGMPNM